MLLSMERRNIMAAAIVEAMQAAYEAEGEEGDFADALRYYKQDASNIEIDADYQKWVKKVPEWHPA